MRLSAVALTSAALSATPLVSASDPDEGAFEKRILKAAIDAAGRINDGRKLWLTDPDRIRYLHQARIHNEHRKLLRNDAPDSNRIKKDSRTGSIRRQVKSSSSSSSSSSKSSKSDRSSKSAKSDRTSKIVKSPKSAKTPALVAGVAETLRLLQLVYGVDIERAARAVLQLVDYSDPAIVGDLVGVLVDNDICFTGNASSVQEQCGDECCIGNDACSFDGTATICRGSCDGDQSCQGLGEGTIVFPYSCIEESSCASFAGDAVPSQAPPPVVGPDSCTGLFACRYASSYGDVGPVSVGYNACQGVQACFTTNVRNPNRTVIDNDACVGDLSCYAVGGSGPSSDVQINSNACNGRQACFTVGTTYAETITIKTDACMDDNACTLLGAFGPTEVYVGESSCTGGQSCRLVANLAQNASVGKASCQGMRACRYLGSVTPGLVFVDDGACYEQSSCDSLGRYSRGNIKVNSTACRGVEACMMLGTTSAVSVDVGSDACVGTEVCSRVGTAATATTFVGESACAGNGACTEFGVAVVGNTVGVSAGLCTSTAVTCSAEENSACSGSGCTASFVKTDAGQPCSEISCG